jgi:hypothetical protein
MIGLPNPWMILGAIAVVTGTYWVGHSSGWDKRDQEMQSEIAAKNAESRATEIKLNEEINANASKLAEANNAITEKQTALDRAIRAGRVRVSTPTSCVPTAASPAPATGDRNQAPSQPDRAPDQPSDSERETLAAIAALIAEADKHINQLNACIDSYNKVREQLNGKR